MADDDDFQDGLEGEKAGRRKKERPVRNILVKEGDAPVHIRAAIIECAQVALDDQLEKGGPEKYLAKAVAENVKQQMDKAQGGTWHAIVGCHFGGNVTSDSRTMLNFKIDNTWFLVFRSGPPEKPKPASPPPA